MLLLHQIFAIVILYQCMWCTMTLRNNEIRYLQNIKNMDLDLALDRGFDVMNLIYQRFEFHNWYWRQFFLAAWNMPTRTWDMLKYRIAIKALDGIVNGNPERYFMIFGGSSVTAGHDCYQNQSYPSVFERRVKPIFDALGINLVIRNIAQGQSPCRPSDLCYEALGGPNPDWIGWEQSFNCKTADIMEMMARQAVLNHAVVHFSASGAYLPDDCDYDNSTVLWTSEEWTPEIANITDKFVPNRTYLSELRSTLNIWYEDGNPIEKFIAPLKGQYSGSGAHGFSIWGHVRHLFQDVNRTGRYAGSAYSFRPPCINNGGPHWMAKQSAEFPIGEIYKKWHPSPAMHMLRGELLAFNYLAAILDGVYMIKDDLVTLTPELASQKYKQILDSLYVPAPVQTMHCYQQECGTKSKCFTEFTPHYNNDSYLHNIIVGNSSGWVWTYKNHLGSIYRDPKWGFHDSKPAYDSAGPGVSIHLRIDISRDESLVMMCGTVKDSLRHVIVYLDVNATVIGPLYNPDTNKNRTLMAYEYRGDECYNIWHVPSGVHVLSIMTDPKYPDHVASLSHLITFE